MYGHFLQNKQWEAIVLANAALREKTRWMLVLRNDGKEWEQVLRMPEYCRDVLIFDQAEHLDHVVCTSGGMGQGYLVTHIDALQFSSDGLKRKRLVSLESDDTCSSKYPQKGFRSWSKVDVNNDGQADLRVTVDKGVCDYSQDSKEGIENHDFIFTGSEFAPIKR